MADSGKIREYLKNNPNVAISLPTILCFIQFITDVIDIFKTGEFNSNMLNQLVSSANGFEAVSLFFIMLILKNKK